MNVYALTPTGMRPEGLALLGEYLNAQTYKGTLTWVIVDDCDPGTRVPRMRKGITVDVVRPGWRWQPGENTQARCMALGLAGRVGINDAVIILEDDDVYLPEHVSNMLFWLEKADLVGERDSWYYNVTTGRWRILPGKFHASLCSVACKGQATDHLLRLCQGGGKMLDMRLWRTFAGPKKLLDSHNVIGIKGLPGRPGIGVGHRDRFGSIDVNNTLQTWIGDYADNYSIFGRAA